MSVAGVVAKNAPVVAPLLFAAFHTEIAAVIGGLVFGAMWRAANLRSEGKPWDAVRSDLVISFLVGGANTVLALALVEWLNVALIMAMAIGVMIGATGLRAVPEARDVLINALRRKLIGDEVIYVQPSNQKINETMDQLRDQER